MIIKRKKEIINLRFFLSFSSKLFRFNLKPVTSQASKSYYTYKFSVSCFHLKNHKLIISVAQTSLYSRSRDFRWQSRDRWYGIIIFEGESCFVKGFRGLVLLETQPRG